MTTNNAQPFDPRDPQVRCPYEEPAITRRLLHHTFDDISRDAERRTVKARRFTDARLWADDMWTSVRRETTERTNGLGDAVLRGHSCI